MLASFSCHHTQGSRGCLHNTLDNYRLQMVNLAFERLRHELTANNAGKFRRLLANKRGAQHLYPARGPEEYCFDWMCRWPLAAFKGLVDLLRTGKPLPPGQQSDLWLFVINQAEVNGVPAIT